MSDISHPTDIRLRAPYVLLFALLSSGLAHGTQPPGKNAWDELKPNSEAHAVMKQRCQAEAGEEFFATRENIKGIFLESEEHALSYIDGSSNSYGISYSNPPYAYLRNGLKFVEYHSGLAAVSRFEAVPKGDTAPFRRFDTRTHRTESVANRSAHIRVSYKRTTSDSEEKLGVFGRFIEVTDDTDATVLARRKDFVWLNQDRQGAHGGFVCPTLKEAEHLPISFLNRVINVKTYACWKKFEAERRAMPDKYDIREKDASMSRLQACEASYFK